MGDWKDTLKQVVRGLALASGICVFILGIVHVCQSSARIYWPDSFKDDSVNRHSWRDRLFSLRPIVFVDTWTPTFFGLIGIAFHFNDFPYRAPAKNMPRCFVLHFVMALFGAIGYEGGLGIIFSIFPLLTALLALVASFVAPGKAHFDFKSDSVHSIIKT